MEALQLQHAPLCLHDPEIEEVAKETNEASEHRDVVMEDTSAQLDKGKKIASEDQQKAQECEPKQQIVVSENQNADRTSFGVIPEVILKTLTEMKEESALAKQHFDMQDLLFEMILSRLQPPPPPQNPKPQFSKQFMHFCVFILSKCFCTCFANFCTFVLLALSMKSYCFLILFCLCLFD